MYRRRHSFYDDSDGASQDQTQYLAAAVLLNGVLMAGTYFGVYAGTNVESSVGLQSQLQASEYLWYPFPFTDDPGLLGQVINGTYFAALIPAGEGSDSMGLYSGPITGTYFAATWFVDFTAGSGGNDVGVRGALLSGTLFSVVVSGSLANDGTESASVSSVLLSGTLVQTVTVADEVIDGVSVNGILVSGNYV